MVCQYKDEYLIKTKIILFFNKAEFGENCFHFPCRITLCSLLFLICSFYLLTLRIHIMCSLINLVILFFNVFNKKTFRNKRATTIESKLKTHFLLPLQMQMILIFRNRWEKLFCTLVFVFFSDVEKSLNVVVHLRPWSHHGFHKKSLFYEIVMVI